MLNATETGDTRGVADEQVLDRDDAFVRRRTARYFERVLRRRQRLDAEAVELLAWLLPRQMGEICGFVLDRVPASAREEVLDAGTGLSAEALDYESDLPRLLKGRPALMRQVLRQVRRRLLAAARTPRRGKASDLERNLGCFRRTFDLSEVEAELCLFLYVLDNWAPVSSFFETHLGCQQRSGRTHLAAALGLATGRLSPVFEGKARTLGIIEESFSTLDLEDAYASFFQDGGKRMLAQLFRRPPRGPVPLSCYGVDPEQLAYLQALLCKRPDGAGSHVLLYGAPGTGKSTFARRLLGELGVRAYEVLRQEDNTAQRQRAAIVSCLSMTGASAGAVVIVDEADNVLSTAFSWLRRGETQDKAWLNQLLEQPGLRMVWIVNSVGDIDASVRRRFAHSLHFRALGRRQRIAMWSNVVQRHRLARTFGAEDIRRLATEYTLGPGAVEIALGKGKAAGLRGPRLRQAVRLSLAAHAELLADGQPQHRPETVGREYSLEGLNIDGDVSRVVDDLRRFDRHQRQHGRDTRIGMRLLFFGQPGTGKSELARYLATAVDRDLMTRRASDLLSMWVGGTEHNIASAFTEAEQQEAVLLIDEADSFVFSRDAATRSWEVSGVNEFLSQLERFRGIVVCTTNRLRDLDVASIRRFDHKLGFDFLTPDGNESFYGRMLAPLTKQRLDDVTRSRLRELRELAPGDFRIVRDRFALREPRESTPPTMVGALAEEARLKQVQRGNCAGFAIQRRSDLPPL